MAQGNYADTYTDLDDVDVDETELDAEEGIEVGDNLDAWMAEMLSGPSRYEY